MTHEGEMIDIKTFFNVAAASQKKCRNKQFSFGQGCNQRDNGCFNVVKEWAKLDIVEKGLWLIIQTLGIVPFS